VESKEYFDREVKLYELYRDYIKAEDLLRNSRTAAFLTIQGLFFAAIGVTLPIGQSEHGLSDRLIFVLRIIIIVVGLLTCLHTAVRDKSMRRSMCSVDINIRKIKARKIPAEWVNFAKENAFWLDCLPKWHYRGSKWLYRLSFHRIFALGWISILILLCLARYY
jgi:hypothetical protein